MKSWHVPTVLNLSLATSCSVDATLQQRGYQVVNPCNFLWPWCKNQSCPRPGLESWFLSRVKALLDAFNIAAEAVPFTQEAKSHWIGWFAFQIHFLCSHGMCSQSVYRACFWVGHRFWGAWPRFGDLWSQATFTRKFGTCVVLREEAPALVMSLQVFAPVVSAIISHLLTSSRKQLQLIARREDFHSLWPTKSGQQYILMPLYIHETLPYLISPRVVNVTLGTLALTKCKHMRAHHASSAI